MKDAKECDIQLILQGDTLQEDIENLILNSKEAIPESIIASYLRQKQQPKKIIPKPKKQLRLGFRSKQLRRKFQDVIITLPGRRQQAFRVFDFISMSQNGTTTPICLYGNTGCGKTSLITKLIDFFSTNSQTVSKVYLNCMKMLNVNNVYTAIYYQLFGSKPRSYRPAFDLHQKFLSCSSIKNDKTKIIVLDQIDHFSGNKQRYKSFFYNMLEWLSTKAKVILVLISNVVDLTSRLDQKIQSRLKFQNVIFTPYSFQQIQEIIYYKYPDCRHLLEKGGVLFLSKKIANINSDIRLLDQIFKRIIQTYNMQQQKRPLSLQSINKLIYQDAKPFQMNTSYGHLIKILNDAQDKKEISYEITNKLFIQGKRQPTTEEILLMLCQLHDSDFIALSGTRKNSGLCFHDYGIQVNQSLRLFYGQNYQK